MIYILLTIILLLMYSVYRIHKNFEREIIHLLSIKTEYEIFKITQEDSCS